jgi:hypothetical protein
MTNASIAALARHFVGDDEPYEPDDETVAGFIDAALLGLRAKTGVPFLTSAEAVVTLTATPLDLSGNCPIDNAWKEHLSHYVASLISGCPGANNDPQKSAFEMERFKALLEP